VPVLSLSAGDDDLEARRRRLLAVSLLWADLESLAADSLSGTAMIGARLGLTVMLCMTWGVSGPRAAVEVTVDTTGAMQQFLTQSSAAYSEIDDRPIVDAAVATAPLSDGGPS
jgi:hypothetical protein